MANYNKNTVFYRPKFTKDYHQRENITDYLYTIGIYNGKKAFIKYTSEKTDKLPKIVSMSKKDNFSVYLKLADMVEIPDIYVKYYKDVVYFIFLKHGSLFSDENDIYDKNESYFIPKNSIPNDNEAYALIKKQEDELKLQAEQLADWRHNEDYKLKRIQKIVNNWSQVNS